MSIGKTDTWQIFKVGFIGGSALVLLSNYCPVTPGRWWGVVVGGGWAMPTHPLPPGGGVERSPLGPVPTSPGADSLQARSFSPVTRQS
jgi:hypothetical protein